MPPLMPNEPPIPDPELRKRAVSLRTRKGDSAPLNESVARHTAIEGEMELMVSPAETPIRAGGMTCPTVDAAANSTTHRAERMNVFIRAKVPSVKFTKGLQLQILKGQVNETDAHGRKGLYCCSIDDRHLAMADATGRLGRGYQIGVLFWRQCA